MTLRAVVVGCGRMGSEYDRGRHREPRSHAGAYRASRHVRLVAGVDPNRAKRAAFAQLWHVPVFATVDELTSVERPDLWSICTPPAERIGIVRAAVRHGAKGIWCEKPLAESAAQATRIVRMVRKARVPMIVGYLRRWDPGHRGVAKLIADGRLGVLQHVAIHYTRGIRNYGTHAIDLLRWFFGDPEWVRAVPGYDSDAADSSPIALLGYRAGAVAALLPVRRAAYDVFEIDILGSSGRVTLGDLGRRIVASKVVASADWQEGRTLGLGSLVKSPADRPGSMRAALADLVGAVRTGARPACDASDGAAALRIAEAIERAAASGQLVPIRRSGAA